MHSASRGKTYVRSAGEATLYLEVYDAVSGEILGRFVDRKKDPEDAYFSWATRVGNQADAKRIFKRWAKKLRTKFDEVHGK